MKELIFEVLNDMAEELSVAQLKKLQEVLLKRLEESEVQHKPADNIEYLEMFLHAKRIEGCSERTLAYYETTVKHFFSRIETPVRRISTEQIRNILLIIKRLIIAVRLQLIILDVIYPASFPGLRKRTIY